MIPMTLLYSREPNESAIHDEKVDEMYLAGLRTYDRDVGRQIWRRLEEYVATNHLLFFGYQERAVFGANAQLKIHSPDFDDVLGRVLRGRRVERRRGRRIEGKTWRDQ